MKLGDVSEIVSGFTLGRKLPDNVSTRSIPYLRVANVQDGYLDLSDVYAIEATEDEIENYCLQYGDLLLTEGGDADKLGRGTYWQAQIAECIHQNHVFRVRFDLDDFAPQFIAYQFASKYGKDYFLANAKQTTGIATINKQILGSFPLLVPPLAEQKAIAHRLDRQMQEVDRMRQAAEEQHKVVKNMRSSILREAFNSEEWDFSTTTVDDVTSLVIDGPHVTPSYVRKGIPFVTVQNIRARKLLFDKLQYISVEDCDEFDRRGKPEVGDILLTKDGTLGIPCLVDDSRRFSFFVSVALLKPVRHKVDSDFLFYALDSPSVQEQISERGEGAGLKHIVLEEIKAIELPFIEDRDEQIHFVNLLKEKLTNLPSLEAAATYQLDAINALPSAYLREVFGMIDADDPEDEME